MIKGLPKINVQLSAKQLTVLRWLAVPVLYVFCLILFVRVTFPYEALRSRIVMEFNARNQERVLEIKELSGAGIFGVTAEGVRLVPTSGPGTGIASLSFDRARISFSPLASLFGNVKVSYDLDVGGGEIEGRFYQNQEQAELEVTGENVDISGLSVLGDMIGLPLAGSMSGEVEMVLPKGKISDAVGKFALKIDGLNVGDGKAKVRGTIALPKIDAGTLNLVADVKEGRLEIAEFSAKGKDLEFSASGRIRLREPFDRSIVDVEASFQFKERYTTQSDMTKSIFGSPDGKVPGLFDMDPGVRKAKDDKGFYTWRVTGLLTKPAFRPAPKSSAKDKRQEQAP